MINLNQARSLQVPKRKETLLREYSVHNFWQSHKSLLENAWKEWEESEGSVSLGDFLLDKELKDKVTAAWKNPEQEIYVKDLMKELSPGVFQFQMFDPEKLHELRSYLKKVEEAEIPLRPPYGIVLNRKGAMLDQRSEGYLAAPSFQRFYQMLIDTYMRPIARLLFPEVFGFDTQPFGFSIQYQAGMDTSLRMHTDASAVTLNINLNLPREEFSGSEVDFVDPTSGKRNRTSFAPGVAMIHRGNIAHEAQHITSGERTNFVLWLYGDQMQIPRFIKEEKTISPQERWTIPESRYDEVAPF